MKGTVTMPLEAYERLRGELEELKEKTSGSMFELEKSYVEGNYNICLSSSGRKTLDEFEKSHPEYEFEYVSMTAYNVAKPKEPVKSGDA